MKTRAERVGTPSRVKIMTGIYNVRNYVGLGVLDRGETTFAQLLKRAGYATCVVGKWQLGAESDSPRHFGFDESCLWYHSRRAGRYPNPRLDINAKPVNYTNGEYGPDVINDFACSFMEKNRDRPFLLYYPMLLTHCPFEPTPDSADWNPTSPGSKSYKGKSKVNLADGMSDGDAGCDSPNSKIPTPRLDRLASDLGEKKDLSSKHPEVVQGLVTRLNQPYDSGRSVATSVKR